MDPTLDPDELLRQAVSAGLYQPRMQQLQRQYGMGQEFLNTPSATGAQVGQTYMAASPLEHLANAVRRMVGAKMIGDSNTGQQALTSQLGQARQGFLQEMQTAQGGGQGAPEMLARPPDPQRAQQLEMMAAASGDPSLEHAAQYGMQERQMERQNSILQNTMRHQQILEGQGQGRLDLGQGRIDAMNKALALRGIRYNPNSGAFENIAPMVRPQPGPSAGPAAPPAAPGPAGSPAPAPAPTQFPPMGGKQLDKALKDLGRDFDPNASGQGEFGSWSKRYNAGTRVLALAQGPDGKAIDLTPQQMPELAQAVANMVGSGSVAAQAQIEHLLPSSYTKDAAGIYQYFMNEPHGAGQQAFVQNMIDTAKREMGAAKTGIAATQGQRAAKHQRVILGNPAEAARVLSPFGWGIGQDGMPTLSDPTAQQQAQPAPGGAHIPEYKRVNGKLVKVN